MSTKKNYSQTSDTVLSQKRNSESACLPDDPGRMKKIEKDFKRGFRKKMAEGNPSIKEKNCMVCHRSAVVEQIRE
jgi:hypothetical protein